MFISLLSRLVCAWFAFALPAYNTYKALTRAHHTIPSLASYWTVLALFVAFEHTLGLVFFWFPFYWELRTVFLLYISLPQTQGFVYVYNTLLEPWLASNEAAFDGVLASAQNNAVAFCRTRITAVLDLLWNLSNNTPGDAQKPPLKDIAPFTLGPLLSSDPHVTSNPHSVHGDSS